MAIAPWQTHSQVPTYGVPVLPTHMFAVPLILIATILCDPSHDILLVLPHLLKGISRVAIIHTFDIAHKLLDIKSAALIRSGRAAPDLAYLLSPHSPTENQLYNGQV